MKIAWKVALAALAILVVFFGVGSSLLVSLAFQSSLTREIDVAQEELQMLRLSYEAVCIARGVTTENMFKESRGVARVLEENRYFAGRQFRVTTETGRTVYSTMEAPGDQELLEEIDETTRGYSIRREEKSGHVYVHCADTVTLDDGVLYLESARDISSLFTDRETHYRIYRYLLLAVVGAAGGVLFMVSSWLTRPIRDLGKTAGQLAAGDYASRARVSGNDEVSELAVSFNQMADAVEKNVQALADAARQQEDFTASFVHELKTPLTSISGFAEMIESGMAQQKDVRGFAGRIRQEAGRLQFLIDDIMRLSEIEEGEACQEWEPVHLLQIAQDTVETLSIEAREKKVSISCGGEDLVIDANQRMMDELMTNLLSNAVKYNKEGGSAHITVEKQGNMAAILVSDTGIGIPPEHQQRVFERFYRVDKSRSKETGGTGLGLSIVRHIAQVMKGSVILKSQEDVGTEITVLLPFHQEPAGAGGHAGSAGADGHNGR